jgi:Cyclin, N-terminal domain
MNMPITDDNEDRLEALQAMLMQEAMYYTKKDFHSFQMKAMKDLQSQYPAQKLDLVDTSCRTKMCAWFQQICNFCQYDDEETLTIIENAMNYVDRYVVTPKGSVALLDRNYYQGMAITCLYMATKIHASAAISASDMSQITRYVYTTEQIEEMEYHILQALDWRVNPPTASVFVSEFMKIIIAHMHQSQIVTDTDDTSIVSLLRTVKELVHTQMIATFSDEKFLTVPASVIAYTAILNAVQLLVPMHEFHEPFHAIQTLILTNVQDRDQTASTITLVLHYFQQSLQTPESCPMSPTVVKAKHLHQQQRFTSSPITTAAIVTP